MDLGIVKLHRKVRLTEMWDWMITSRRHLTVVQNENRLQ